MPYPQTPVWARRVLSVLRALLYGMSVVMGVGAVWLTPVTVSERLPAVLTDAWGVLAVGGALGCLTGALTRRYRWELTSLPLLIGATLIYALTVWDIATDAPTRTAQAAAITSLMLAFSIRYVDLLIVRGRLRREHDHGASG